MTSREVIQATMQRTGLSARALSRVLGVNERTVRRWQRNERVMAEPTIRLCALLGTKGHADDPHR